MSDESEIAQLKAEVGRVGQVKPFETMMAILETLIELQAGDNPALRPFHRKRVYALIVHRLRMLGLR